MYKITKVFYVNEFTRLYDEKYFLALSALTAVTHFAMVGLARLIEFVI